MRKPLRQKPLLTGLPFALALCLFVTAQSALARQTPPAGDPNVERGVQLYNQRDLKGAIKQFRAALKTRKDDPVVWSYLGQALTLHGDLKEARKALDTSLRLKPDHADAHAGLAFLLMVSEKPREAEAEARRALELDGKQVDAHYVIAQLRLREGAWLKAIEEADAIIKTNDKAAVAYSLKSQALLGLYERGNTILADERRGVYDFNNQTVEEVRAAQPLRLKEAADNLEKYVQLSPKAPDAASLREQMETLLFYAHAAAETDPARKVYSSSDNVARAVITYKPEPGFTEEARRANISGVVRLRAVLAFSGQVEHILVLKRLSHGLTERAVEAARRIKFKPATVNSLPVSQYVVLEYNFNIY